MLPYINSTKFPNFVDVATTLETFNSVKLIYFSSVKLNKNSYHIENSFNKLG